MGVQETQTESGTLPADEGVVSDNSGVTPASDDNPVEPEEIESGEPSSDEETEGDPAEEDGKEEDDLSELSEEDKISNRQRAKIKRQNWLEKLEKDCVNPDGSINPDKILELKDNVKKSAFDEFAEKYGYYNSKHLIDEIQKGEPEIDDETREYRDFKADKKKEFGEDWKTYEETYKTKFRELTGKGLEQLEAGELAFQHVENQRLKFELEENGRADNRKKLEVPPNSTPNKKVYANPDLVTRDDYYNGKMSIDQRKEYLRKYRKEDGTVQFA